MAEDALPETKTQPPAKPVRGGWGWRKYLLAAVLALFGVVTIGVLVLNSPIGHRFVVERIMRYAPASGLRIAIGRIDGSLYGKAKLKDVVLSDSQGAFLRVPDVDLDWRPFNWFTRGLDVRTIVLHRGTLLRRWKLQPGRPDAPLLPNFDIRIDRLELDRLTVAEGIMGERRRIDLVAKADIRKGRALIRTNAKLGGADRFAALLDADPDRDRFDLQLDYVAPKGGLLATLAGADRDLRARIVGKGTWSNWGGALLVDSPDAPFAALRLTNRAGRYGILGLMWSQDLLAGIAAKAAGPAVAIDAEGTLVNSVLDGRFLAIASGARVDAKGKIDLGNNAFDGLVVKAGLRDPGLIEGTRLEGVGLSLELDGAFTDLTARHALVAEQATSGTLRVERFSQTGIATRQGSVWTMPLDVKAARIVTGNATIDPRLVNARLTGRLQLAGSRLSGDNLSIAVPGLAARLTLRGDMAQGGYALAGPVAARGWKLENLGTIDANAKILFKFGSGIPWRLAANVAGAMPKVDNPTLTTIAGTGIKFSGAIRMGSDMPLVFDKASLIASKLSLQVSGRLTGNTTTLSGGGRHVDYGPFTVEASIAGEGPRAVLVFASPLPAAGLKDVRIGLAPIEGGFRIETFGRIDARAVQRHARSLLAPRWSNAAADRAVGDLENECHGRAAGRRRRCQRHAEAGRRRRRWFDNAGTAWGWAGLQGCADRGECPLRRREPADDQLRPIGGAGPDRQGAHHRHRQPARPGHWAGQPVPRADCSASQRHRWARASDRVARRAARQPLCASGPRRVRAKPHRRARQRRIRGREDHDAAPRRADW